MAMRKLAAALGLAGVTLFIVAFVTFASLSPAFDALHDYVSTLGAAGQPYALGWNVFGFAAVGVLLTGFGFAYGRVVRDRVVGTLLALFGIGFAAAGVPLDLGDDGSAASRAHVVAITLGLGAWMLGLARMAYLPSAGRPTRRWANAAAALVLVPMVGQALQWWPMPVTHRLVFLVVFGWVVATSVHLLRGAPPPYRAGPSAS